uniref:RRM domain-containing protein n=1 Tax=Oryza rufipogon TaxID=4529 RepID=A0A0E0PJ59_ORYRU
MDGMGLERERKGRAMAAPWWDSEYKDRSSLEYRVYVGNLPYSVDEQTLMDYFADYGAISAEIAWDSVMGRSRGFGFVNFEDSESVNAAIQGMNGQDIGGRNVTVAQANTRPRRWRA